MANVINIKQVTGLVLQSPVTQTSVANQSAYNRTPIAQGIPGSSGGDTDPVGPQRWPTKL